MDIGETKKIVEVEPVQDPFRRDAPQETPQRELEPDREFEEVPA